MTIRFYRWMTAGFAVYAALAADYPLYRGGPVVGRAAEVFPHASAVLLAGRLPEPMGKLVFRSSVLRDQGVDTSALRTQDRVDAALAALTGVLALTGIATPIGDPEDGLLVLPARDLPSRLHRAERTIGEPVASTRAVVASEMRSRNASAVVVALAGHCHCGCGEIVGSKARFRPGHDARHRSHLMRDLRQGEVAREELERLGWLP